MITNANALQSAIAHLLAAEKGHKITMDAKLRFNVPNIEMWCLDNSLGYAVEDGKLTLWRKA